MLTKSIAVLRVPSEFIAGDAWSFLEEMKPLLKNQRPSLVLDFANVRMIDRSGILVLVKCFEGALKQNGDVKLASVPVELLNALQQTGLDQICDIYETADDACDSFRDQGWMSDAPYQYSAAGEVHSSGD